MELLYVWVDKYRRFRNEGFTFSSEFRFSETFFIDGHNKENIEITVDNKPNVINLFPPSYLNITALVGENGSGKSTLLGLLKLIGGEFTRLAARIVLCYRLKDSPGIIHTVYYSNGKHGPGVKVSIKPSGNLKNITLTKPTPYSVTNNIGIQKSMYSDSDTSIDTVSTIFFSNTFEANIEDLYSGIYNISTNALLFNYTEHFLKTFNPRSTTQKELPSKSPITEFFEKELKQQIDFISYADTNKLAIPDLPEYLQVSFNRNDLNELVSKDSTLQWNKKALNDINAKAIPEISLLSDFQKRMLAMVWLSALYYMLRFDSFNKSNLPDITEINRRLVKISQSDQVIDLIRQLIVDTCTGKKDRRFALIKKLVDGTLETAVRKAAIQPDEVNLYRFRFDINAQLWEVLRIILDIKFSNQDPFLEYGWYGISSGQEALLKQYARFYSLKDALLNNVLWILIDEGDLYLHPQWQKEYFNNLVHFFPVIFPNFKIQLFLASHSPFVVSDLPKNHVIFLSKDDTDIEISDMKETFGTNIHTLFTNSFFLDGLMGNFAKNKIDAVICFLNDLPQKDFVNLEQVQELVRIIGEPIIRNQLQKMIDSRRLEEVQKKYDGLEKRVVSLEKKNKP
ncbi:MAG: hypothetical protein V4539_16425 [Bacteroidota bacterium]